MKLRTIILFSLVGFIGGVQTASAQSFKDRFKSAVNKGKRIRDAALSTFIHHYTFAAKSKSIKYDSRRTI